MGNKTPREQALDRFLTQDRQEGCDIELTEKELDAVTAGGQVQDNMKQKSMVRQAQADLAKYGD